MSRFILLRNQVFNWEDKAPFVKLGFSVRGAIEFDPVNEMLKCHICGNWFEALGNHIAKRHGGKGAVVKYRQTFGINSHSHLCAPWLSEHRKQQSKNSGAIHRMRAVRGQRKEYKGIKIQTAEWENEKALCAAQLIARISKIATEIGATPSIRYVSRADVNAAKKHFGGWVAACKAADLKPNKRGDNNRIEESVLLELLRQFYVTNRKVPKAKDFGHGSLPSIDPYYRKFGGLNAAFVAAKITGIEKAA